MNQDGRLPSTIFKKIWQLFLPLVGNGSSVKSVGDKDQEITRNWVWEVREIVHRLFDLFRTDNFPIIVPVEVLSQEIVNYIFIGSKVYETHSLRTNVTLNCMNNTVYSIKSSSL